MNDEKKPNCREVIITEGHNCDTLNGIGSMNGSIGCGMAIRLPNRENRSKESTPGDWARHGKEENENSEIDDSVHAVMPTTRTTLSAELACLSIFPQNEIGSS